MKNIYDLEGNFYEWTQEAVDTSNRTFRGGSFFYASTGGWLTASRWNDREPTSTDTLGGNSSRSALYVTL